MPALQRDACRQCVCCGARADAYCARCGVTPYCGARCQRRDWADRHRAVCHNLAHLSSQEPDHNNAADLVSIAPAPPLRRPHSPAVERDSPRKDDPNSDRANKKYRQPDPATIFKSASPRGNSAEFHKKPDGRQNFMPRDANQGDSKNIQQKSSSRNEAKPSADNQQKNSPRNEPKPKETTPVKHRTPKPVEVAPKEDKRREVPQEKEVVKEEPKQVQKVSTPVKEVKEESKTKPSLVPKTYLIEHLFIGDSVLLSVDGKAADCRTSTPGFVCLSMHEKFESDYQKLCEDYVLDCESDSAEFISVGTEQPRPIRKWLAALKEDLKENGPPALQKLLSGLQSLTPGTSLSYLNPEDGGWYRARCLNPTTIALLDSGKIVQLKPTDKCKKLAAKYQEIPEFCCVLDARVEVGANLKCTLVSQTAGGYKVTIHDVDTGIEIGGGEIARWSPKVEYPIEPAAPVAPKIPEVPRPPLETGARVLLTDAAPGVGGGAGAGAGGVRACVRPAAPDAQRRFDDVLQGVVLYGTAATPLKEPPLQGQTVVAKFTDGLHYRALCRRTNIKQNKYQLEYIEYGNIQVTQLEMLYPCPQDYDIGKMPTVASILTFDVGAELTPAALEYIEGVKDEEMILTLPDGAKTAPSGSLATLTVVKTNENMQKKLLELSTPDWKKIEERGGDVVESQCLMFSDMECVQLPAAGGALQVLDVSLLAHGSVSACQQGLAHAQYVFTRLAAMMAEYCNSELGRQPYLPKVEELCIAKCPPNPNWFRAVFLEQLNGPGGDKARILFVDTGYLGVVSVELLRKMLPEFVKGLPAVAVHLEIKDFPSLPTPDMLSKARRHMKIDEQGRGELRVTNCTKLDDGMYSVEAKELVQAMAARK